MGCTKYERACQGRSRDLRALVGWGIGGCRHKVRTHLEGLSTFRVACIKKALEAAGRDSTCRGRENQDRRKEIPEGALMELVHR